MIAETVLIVGLAVFTVLSLWMLRRWISASADLLWMLALRPRLVATVIAIGAFVGWILTGVPFPNVHLMTCRFLVLLIAVPIVGRPLCNWVALKLAGATSGATRDFIFEAERLAQQRAYIASLEPDT